MADGGHSGVTNCACCHKFETVAGEYKKCAQCHKTSYCSKVCQCIHWKQHKSFCAVLRGGSDPAALPTIDAIQRSVLQHVDRRKAVASTRRLAENIVYMRQEPVVLRPTLPYTQDYAARPCTCLTQYELEVSTSAMTAKCACIGCPTLLFTESAPAVIPVTFLCDCRLRNPDETQQQQKTQVIHLANLFCCSRNHLDFLIEVMNMLAKKNGGGGYVVPYRVVIDDVPSGATVIPPAADETELTDLQRTYKAQLDRSNITLESLQKSLTELPVYSPFPIDVKIRARATE